MTKSFKLSIIFLVTVINLVVMRLIMSTLNLSDNIAGWLFSTVYQVGCLGILPLFMYRMMISKDFKQVGQDFMIKKRLNPICYLLAIVVGLALFYVTIGVSSVWSVILSIFGYTHISGVGTIYSSPEVLILQIITTAMMPAFFEEFIDRGLMMTMLENEKDERKKIIIIGVFFGLLHQNITQFGYAIVGGLIFAYMAYKTKSIWLGVIAHFINNFLAVMCEYGTQKGNWLGKLYEGLFYNLQNRFLLIALSWLVVGYIIYLCLKAIAHIQAKEKGNEGVLPTPNAEKIEYRPSYERIYQIGENKIIIPRIEKRFEEGIMWGAIVITGLTTFFTFVWGMMR